MKKCNLRKKCCSEKRGFTLIEVLTVVIIIGILSALGFSSLADVIYKSRAKDAAVNTAAYIERIAIESKRLDQKLCIQVSASTLTASDCDGKIHSTFEIGNNFNFDGIQPPDGTTLNNSVIHFEPTIGLSNLKDNGCLVAVRYASTKFCGAAVKTQDHNFVQAFISTNDCATWGEI